MSGMNPKILTITLLNKPKAYCFNWLMQSILMQSFPQALTRYAAVFDGTELVKPWVSAVQDAAGDADFICPEVFSTDRYSRVAELYGASQELVERSEADFVWVVEADQPPPVEALECLTDVEGSMVSAACARRGNSMGLNAVGLDGEDMEYSRGLRFGSLIAAKAVSCGCLLVERDAFLGVDWSEFPQYRAATGKANDWYLCKQIAETPFVHTGVLVPHVDKLEREFRIQWVMEHGSYLLGRTEVISRDATEEIIHQTMA